MRWLESVKRHCLQLTNNAEKKNKIACLLHVELLSTHSVGQAITTSEWSTLGYPRGIGRERWTGQ